MNANPSIIQTARGGIELARAGSGPSVLLLHGAMGGWDQSLLLGESACGPEGCDFIAVSRPGYLGTPLSAGRSPGEQADLCAALLDALGVPQAVVMAVSGGGQCALQFALRHAGRCRALILISACNAPLDAGVPFRFRLFRWMARVPPLVARMRRKVAANPDRAASRSIPDPELRARTLADPDAGTLLRAQQTMVMDRIGERIAGTENDILQSRAPFEYPVERITVPTLIVHGTGDELVPFAHAKALAGRIRGAELLAIPGGGHVALFTHLAEVRSRVAMYLC